MRLTITAGINKEDVRRRCCDIRSDKIIALLTIQLKNRYDRLLQIIALNNYLVQRLIRPILHP